MSKRKKIVQPNAECPCGGNKTYSQCCEPLHNGAPADSAEALMRSRYSAFALQLPDYIQHSWHISTRPPHNLSERAAAEQTHWLGLQIKRHDLLDADHARVEFRARYKVAGRAHFLHEVSRFVREDGHWFYIDGEIIQ